MGLVSNLRCGLGALNPAARPQGNVLGHGYHWGGCTFTPCASEAAARSVSANHPTLRAGARSLDTDQTRPAFIDGFTRNTLPAMIESVRGDALTAGLTTRTDWDRGVANLRRTADGGGTFHRCG